MALPSVSSNRRYILVCIFIKVNTSVARLIIAVEFTVYLIFAMRRFSQIYNAIVVTNSINVIDLGFRPFASVKQPRQSVALKCVTVNHNGLVAIPANVPSNLAGTERPPSSASALPSENPGYVIIRQKRNCFFIG